MKRLLALTEGNVQSVLEIASRIMLHSKAETKGSGLTSSWPHLHMAV